MNKKMINVICILALFCLLTQAMKAQVQYQVPLTVTNGITVQPLTIGVSGDGPGGSIQDNTIGADVDSVFGVYQEALAPPVSPAPFAFDARILTIPGRVATYPTGLGGGVYKDFRGFTNAAQVDSFRITIDGDNVDLNNTIISWPTGLNVFGSSWTIKPQSGSEWAPVNMLSTTTAVIPAGVLQRNIIIIKGGATVAGPTFAVDTDSLHFGNVSVGGSAPLPFTVQNTGTVNNLTISGVTAFGSFSVLPNSFPIVLGPGGSQLFSVTFAPIVVGPVSGNIQIAHDAPNSPGLVAVDGNGVVPGFSVVPSSVTFPGVPAGFNKIDSVTATNTGLGSLTVFSATPDDSSFSVSPSIPVVLGPSVSAKYYITFSPTSVGLKVGNIIFVHDAAGSPDTVAVSGTGNSALKFTSVPPESIAALDGAGKLVKAAKRKKSLYPNWTNLTEEVVAQGGFAPPALNGSTESDSAGGEVIGIGFMFKKNPGDPLAPKWTQIKQTGASDTAWARLSAWDFKKSKGKSASQLAKTLRNKAFNHWTSDPTSTPRGFDSTLTPGQPKRKQMKKQMTKLDPKKTPSKLFAELVAFKLNIASSQLGNSPAGFGDLVYDVDSSLYDEMSLVNLSEKADSLMTFWHGGDSTKYAQLYQALYDINRAFVGVLDTANWERIDSSAIPPFARLRVKGNVDLATVPFLKVGALRPTIIRPTSHDTETEEDFEDGDYFDDEFDGDGTPVAAKLYQNYPNPFNPTTNLSFRLGAPSIVTLKIYNILGQEVATLLNGDQMDEGYQTVQFNPSGMASGVYFYQINVQDVDGQLARMIETHKMLLVK